MKIVFLAKPCKDEDILRCLDMQVDEFLSKTSSIEVILKRLSHIFRRSRVGSLRQARGTMVVDHMLINRLHRKVYIDNQDVHLTNCEFEMLLSLINNKERIMSREALIELLRPSRPTSDLELRTIDSYIQSIRSKTKSQSIVTIRNKGYKCKGFY